MTDAKQTSPRRRRSWAEPYKIKVVEPLKITTRAEREQGSHKRVTILFYCVLKMSILICSLIAALQP